MPRTFKDDGDQRMSSVRVSSTSVMPSSSGGGNIIAGSADRNNSINNNNNNPAISSGDDIFAMDYFDTMTEEDRELKELERRLNEEVDEDFFQEPRRFNTLHRVIDVLGLQMIDGAVKSTTGSGDDKDKNNATGASSSNALLSIKQRKSNADLERNPAYRSLKGQQQIVEGAIEHMAVIHCADLNGSVIQVGKVARQFSDAVSRVRSLRKQVRDIQDTLGASSAHATNMNMNTKDGKSKKKSKSSKTKSSTSGGNNNGGNTDDTVGGGTTTTATTPGTPTSTTAAAAMSLRELWMKKLECEASLALLEKLDIIRAAPMHFDQLIGPHTSTTPRIGAAVLTITHALQTMFSDDVAQVQALHKIMEHLLLRKQWAEEICWDTLSDVIFLRTGNGLILLMQQNYYNKNNNSNSNNNKKNTGTNGTNNNNLDSVGVGGNGTTIAITGAGLTAGPILSGSSSAGSEVIVNPFMNKHARYAIEEDNDYNYYNPNDDNDSVRSDHSGASLFSIEDDDKNTTTVPSSNTKDGSTLAAAAAAATPSTPNATMLNVNRCRMMIPLPIVEMELDLEADERRCLEEIALSGMFNRSSLLGGHGGGGSNGNTSAAGNASSSIINRYHRRHNQHQALPRYADPILALRILVECIAKLNRLEDIERMIEENLRGEIRTIVQREQARTFSRLERMRRRYNTNKVSTIMNKTGTTSKSNSTTGNTSTAQGNANINNNTNVSNGTNHAKATDTVKEFRRHLTGMLSAFGCVLVRLSHLAEVLRIRICSDRELLQKTTAPSSLMRAVISSATAMMHDEIKEFLKPCLYKFDDDEKEGMGTQAVGEGSTAFETGLFSLNIVEQEPTTTSKNGQQQQQHVSTATRSNVMEMTTEKFITTILFPKTGLEPEVRHALAFRRSIARWNSESEHLKRELAIITNEDMSSASYRYESEESAIAFLDVVIQQDLLPVLQEEAVNGTVKGLERAGSFDPILGRTMFTQSHSNGPDDVSMCFACKSMFDSTGPLFLALHRLPRGGEMYLPLVAVMEHVMLTFISRVKQQVNKITENKTSLTQLMKEGRGPPLSAIMEKRKPAIALLRAYTDSDSIDLDESDKRANEMTPITPPPVDSTSRRQMPIEKEVNPLDDIADGVEGEEFLLKLEIAYLKPFLDFDTSGQSTKIVVCTDDELMKAACLAHSLLKLAGLLEKRLIIRSTSGLHKSLTSTRALREAIKTIKTNGMKMAKFCRLEMLMQTILRMGKICTSSTLVARDAVRIPSSVNDLGEYLTSASDNLREAAGNAIAAYSFSSLEQYIPFCLMQSVRVIIAGRGVVIKSPLTLNGIEALDRSGSVLYRDLKGATSFNNSFWDMELAAISFECSASFIAMMELEMEELEAYYAANRDEFSEDDFQLMFTMNGPRRRGDINKYNLAKMHSDLHQHQTQK